MPEYKIEVTEDQHARILAAFGWRHDLSNEDDIMEKVCATIRTAVENAVVTAERDRRVQEQQTNPFIEAQIAAISGESPNPAPIVNEEIQ